MNLEHLPLNAVFHPSRTGGHAPAEHLMIVMHGRGDSPRGFEWMPGHLGIPSMNYLMLEAPDAYDMGGVVEGFSWYDLPPNRLPGILRSRSVLGEVFQVLLDQGFEYEKMFLFGFSQGCVMTLEFGGRYPHRLAGYIGISGFCNDPDLLIQEAATEAKNGDWLITHGTGDEVISFTSSKAQMKMLQDGGFNLTFKEYDKTHTIDDAEELPMLRAWIQERLK